MRLVRVSAGFVLLLLSLLIFKPDLHAAQINSSQLKAMVTTCLKLIQTEDFEGVAMMYHYPEDYVENELSADIRAVANSLNVFSEEFGRFGPVAPLKARDLYVNIFATSGTHDYWDKQEKPQKVELSTEFQNYGPGYLVFQIVNIVGIPEIKAIAYGLPVSGESVGRIKQVGEKMMRLNPTP